MTIYYATSFYEPIGEDGFPILDDDEPPSFEVPDGIEITPGKLAWEVVTKEIENICFNAPIVPQYGIPNNGVVTITVVSKDENNSILSTTKTDYKLSLKESQKIKLALGLKEVIPLTLPLVME